LGDRPTREGVSEGLDALVAARGHLIEPVPPVLRLHLLSIAARQSGDEGDIQRAIDACLTRGWPRCDRESVLAMGVSE
jgi:hypothetical protein